VSAIQCRMSKRPQSKRLIHEADSPRYGVSQYLSKTSLSCTLWILSDSPTALRLMCILCIKENCVSYIPYGRSLVSFKFTSFDRNINFSITQQNLWVTFSPILLTFVDFVIPFSLLHIVLGGKMLKKRKLNYFSNCPKFRKVFFVF
jgi:hypothetical protein